MVNRFLEEQLDGVPVTKYLEMTVIEFLGTSTAHFLEENDISVTKFLDYLNHHTDLETSNMLVTEFLDSAVADYL